MFRYIDFWYPYRQFNQGQFATVLRWLARAGLFVMYALPLCMAIGNSRADLTLERPYYDPTTTEVLITVIAHCCIALIPLLGAVIGHFVGLRLTAVVDRDATLGFLLFGAAAGFGIVLSQLRALIARAYGEGIDPYDLPEMIKQVAFHLLVVVFITASFAAIHAIACHYGKATPLISARQITAAGAILALAMAAVTFDWAIPFASADHPSGWDGLLDLSRGLANRAGQMFLLVGVVGLLYATFKPEPKTRSVGHTTIRSRRRPRP